MSIHVVNMRLGRISGAECGLFLDFSQCSYNTFSNSLVYLCGVDFAIMESNMIKNNRPAYVIYQGLYAASASFNIDVILPVAVYTETAASYINLEGRYRKTQVAVVHELPRFNYSDSQIFRILSTYQASSFNPLDVKLKYFISLDSFFSKILNYSCS